MKKIKMKSLLVNDNDLECNCENLTLTDMSLCNVSFNEDDLKDYNLVIYVGSKGQKILKADYFRTGIVK